MTAYDASADRLLERIDALSEGQMQAALNWLSGYNPDATDQALTFAERQDWARTYRSRPLQAGDRVAHVRTDAPGDVTDVIPAVTWQAETGPWAYVRFDDGLRCWCPVSTLGVVTP